MPLRHAAALRVGYKGTQEQLYAAAAAMYERSGTIKPLWNQLGTVSQSVWADCVALRAAGHPRWWSIDPDKLGTLFTAASSSGIRAAPKESFIMSLNHKQVADQLDVISEAFTALASTFRSTGSGTADSDADEPAAKPVRGTKSAAKPAAKAKAKANTDTELSIDDVRSKLKELVEAKGKEKMVEALESVGAGKLADVDESQYQELVDNAQAAIDEEDDEPVAKKAPAKGKKVASLDDVNDAARALIAADKPAYLKLAKKLGKPSEMDEDDYVAAITAYEAAMPEEDGADDDLL